MRKHKLITVDADNRDKGKSFLILEKSAFDTERWATRALLALSRSGADIPQESIEAGALGVLLAGLAGFRQMSFEAAEPILEEMLPCIHFVPDPTRKDPATDRPFTRALMLGDDTNDGDIEEMATLMMLRGEVLELHLGFSVTAVLSTLGAAVMNSNQPDTSTSPKAAAKSSRRAKQA